jgi:hypothetical protein
MGVVEDAMEGGVPRVLVGLGLAVAAPIVLPAVSAGARPLAKSLVKGFMTVAGGMRELVAEAREQMSDLMAEVREETRRDGATAAVLAPAAARGPESRVGDKPVVERLEGQPAAP